MSRRIAHSRPHAKRFERGLTLIELMISTALGLLVTMAMAGLLISVKSTYLLQDEQSRMQDGGRYAMEVIGRSVRQVTHENRIGEPAYVASDMTASVFGLDARSLKASTPGVDAPLTKSVNGSDVLSLRFFGSGAEEGGDGTMLNCAGFGVAAAPAGVDPAQGRGWSIFYVAEDATGEPELYCKYRGSGSWTAQAIARGVESFQVLYALDTDADGLPNRLVNAAAIEALDNSLALGGHTAAERELDRNRKTHWKKVVAIRLALLMRGTSASTAGSATAEYHLFGPDYSKLKGAADPGVHVRVATLPKPVRNRPRRLVNATIRLRLAQSPEKERH